MHLHSHFIFVRMLIFISALAILSPAVNSQVDRRTVRSDIHNSHMALTPRVTPHSQNDDLFSQRGPFQEQGKTVWEYKLVVTEQEHKLAGGMLYKVWAYGGRIPGPTLTAREGDWVRIHLINDTSASHTIHSHGLFVPHRMDGVPHSHGASHQAGGTTVSPYLVNPGESFTYEYIARPAGTHFYHCHQTTNEHLNRGMSGVLIVFPRIPEPHVDHDVAMLLQEWNSNYARGGTPGHPREVDDYDFFTINGKSYPETEMIKADIGEIVRIRFINAGAQAHFMHLHGHTFLVTHKDGAPLAEPIEMDTVAVGPGERVDILIRANNPGEWPLHCHTVAHQTNAGLYPGGMMAHLKVGDVSNPTEGDGPVTSGVEQLRDIWRRSARRRLNIR
jgi:manganese oxidase